MVALQLYFVFNKKIYQLTDAGKVNDNALALALGKSTLIGYFQWLFCQASSRVLKEFSNFREVNIFLRGMFPLVGFKSIRVYYERNGAGDRNSGD